MEQCPTIHRHGRGWSDGARQGCCGSSVTPYRLSPDQLDEEIIRIGTTRYQVRNSGVPLRVCLSCKHVTTAQRRADDPLKSDTARWLNSALKPPE